MGRTRSRWTRWAALGLPVDGTGAGLPPREADPPCDDGMLRSTPARPVPSGHLAEPRGDPRPPRDVGLGPVGADGFLSPSTSCL